MTKVKYVSLGVLLIGFCGLLLYRGRVPDTAVMRVGTISGPESALMTVAQHVAQTRYGLRIKVVEFNDYLLPNAALNDGSLDANMFQHQPYLEESIRQHGYDFSIIGRTFIYPMGIYSYHNRIPSLRHIPQKATVAIPNDPTNESRALFLLEKAGLIKLAPNTGFLATLNSIVANPKSLRFRELDAAQLTRVLEEVELAVINTNYAVLAKLYPTEDALFKEDTHSPYANIVVVKKSDEGKVALQQVADALHSDEVIAAAKNLFKGQAIQAWESKSSQNTPEKAID